MTGPAHEWASDPRARDVLAGLFGDRADLDAMLDRVVGPLSGGERRRVALAQALVGEHDVLVLDEPTNHLDVEGIDWLARHLLARREALVVVTHDRWFLDEVCQRTWEVQGGSVHAYDGGYSAYVLARAERDRMQAATDARRANLVRKELAWLRRGPPARTSKPQFRIDAANALIAEEPPPRDGVELVRFASTRLGRTVYDVLDATVEVGGRTLLEHLTWLVGPGDRIGIAGVNGSGKTSLLRLLVGELRAGRRQGGAWGHRAAGLPLAGRGRARPGAAGARGRRGGPARGRPRQGTVDHRDPDVRAVRLRRERAVDAGGRAVRRRAAAAAAAAAADGRAQRAAARRADERPRHRHADRARGPARRLGRARWWWSRTTGTSWSGSATRRSRMLGDGGLRDLPGGVDEYLALRRARRAPAAAPGAGRRRGSGRRREPAPTDAAATRAARKELARLDRQMDKLRDREARLHDDMAAAAADHERVLELDASLRALREERDVLEHRWLELAETAEA